MSGALSIPKVSVPLDPADLKGVSGEDRETVMEIFADLSGAAERIKRAGLRWMQLTPKTRQKVTEALPTTWSEFLVRLERVGSGTLHPALYYSAGIGARRLARLPLDEQARWMAEKIPVVTLDGRNHFDEHRVDVADLSEEECRQVFKELAGDTGAYAIRTVEEQQAWLRNKRDRDNKDADVGTLTVINRPGRWKVQRGRAIIDGDKAKEGFTKRDAQLLLRDLSAED